MYAQLVSGSAAPERRCEVDRLVAEQVIPALRQEPGFCGTLNLVERTTGDAVLLVLWESAELAQRSLDELGAAFVAAMANVAAISTRKPRPTSVWEVDARA